MSILVHFVISFMSDLFDETTVIFERAKRKFHERFDNATPGINQTSNPLKDLGSQDLRLRVGELKAQNEILRKNADGSREQLDACRQENEELKKRVNELVSLTAAENNPTIMRLKNTVRNQAREIAELKAQLAEHTKNTTSGDATKIMHFLPFNPIEEARRKHIEKHSEQNCESDSVPVFQ